MNPPRFANLYMLCGLALSLCLPYFSSGAPQRPADQADSTFKDWYFTPKGAFGRVPLLKTKNRAYIKISHPSNSLTTIQNFNPAGILVNTINARLANGHLSLITSTDRWGFTYDSLWFRPDDPNEFIVTEKKYGQNPFLPCKAYRYTYSKDLLVDILGLVDSTKPGTNKDGVAHYVFERYDDPARFNLLKSEIFYNEIDMPVFSRSADCHQIKYEYDQEGNLQSRSVYDEHERPTADRSGVFTTKYKYDHDDNKTEEDYFNIGNAPCRTTSGYDQEVMEYKRGLLVKKAYYIDDIVIVRSTRLADSVASIEYKYDQDGNETEATYFDQDGVAINNTSGCHRNLSMYSSNGMLIGQSTLSVLYNPLLSQVTDPGTRYKRDDQGRLIGLSYVNGHGQGIIDIFNGTFLTKYALDNWGRTISTSFWQDDSTKMLCYEGYHEKKTEYNADGQVSSESYYGRDEDLTKGKIGFSKELISYNDQGLVAEHKYFDGSTPVTIGDHDGSPSHYHSIRLGYDYYNNLRSFDYYDSQGNPVNASLQLHNGETINCQHIDINYTAGSLPEQTVHDSGNIAPPVLLDCSKGDCMLPSGRKLSLPLHTFNNTGTYHGRIRIDSLYADQLAFVGRDSILIFLNEYESALSRVGCATLYRLAPINKYYQFDGEVTDYYLANDSVADRLIYDKGTLNGPCIFYYQNGQVKEKGDYVNNSKVGNWDYYYDNGQKAKTVQFTAQTSRLLECYTEKGEILAQNGNGRFEGQILTNTLLDPVEYNIKGNVKDGLPDGEWSLYTKYITSVNSVESFSTGKFNYGTFYSFIGKADYKDHPFSRCESLHPYEKLDYYGQNDFCLVAGKKATQYFNIKSQFHTDDFAELKEGFHKILKSNRYQDYSGWICVDLKFDASGRLRGNAVRLYQQNDQFKNEILKMLGQLTNLNPLTMNDRITPYEKFFIVLVESNQVVIPEEFLTAQRLAQRGFNRNTR